MFKFLFLIFLFPQIIFGSQLTSEQIDFLKLTQAKFSVIKDLKSQKVITTENEIRISPLVSIYLDQASRLVGQDVTESNLDSLISSYKKDTSGGFEIFKNIMLFLAGVLLFLAVCGLVGHYLYPYFLDLPIIVYEVIVYGCTALAFSSGYLFPLLKIGTITFEPLWLAIPAAFAFAGSVCFTYNAHGSGREILGLVSFPVVLFGLCCLVWGPSAVFYHTLYPQAYIPFVLAFMSVMALHASLGYSVFIVPGCIFLGWTEEDVIPRSTTASFLILAGYVFSQLASKQLPVWLSLFSTGSLFMGAFVFYSGMLVMSSKWYSWPGADANKFVRMQFLTVISGLAAFYIGATYDIPILLGIGGTFFTLYLCEKYYEIPWSGINWAWAMLGFAIGIYFVIGFASAHPAYFIWTMPALVS